MPLAEAVVARVSEPIIVNKHHWSLVQRGSGGKRNRPSSNRPMKEEVVILQGGCCYRASFLHRSMRGRDPKVSVLVSLPFRSEQRMQMKHPASAAMTTRAIPSMIWTGHHPDLMLDDEDDDDGSCTSEATEEVVVKAG